MKIKLWNEHIASAMVLALPQIAEDNSNLSDFYIADVVGNRRFAQNFGGYPRSDIAEINAQVSLQQAQNLLRDLAEIPVTDVNSGLTDAQIMLGHRSKYVQTPSESVRWLESQIEYRDLKRYEAKQSSEGKIDFSDTSNPNVDE